MLSALGIPREDRLALLGHAQTDIHGRVYDRHEDFNEKFVALLKWERHLAEILEPSPNDIVELGARR